jgi:2-(1,2-epoxy-1,2-dihydrophenyl)acetyl-CoA isomerase
LVDAVTRAEFDPDVGCVVVTGAGRGFCSGGDVGIAPPAMRSGDVRDEPGAPRKEFHESVPDSRRTTWTSRFLHDMGKPSIAMINGPCAGAGIGLAGACDLRFAGESAIFVSAFNRHGFSGDYGSTWFWTKILGSGRAREIHILGEKIDAKRGLEIGLYAKVFPDESLRAETLEIAARIAAGSAAGWHYMKANLNMAEDGIFGRAMDHEVQNMNLAMRAAADARRAKRKSRET